MCALDFLCIRDKVAILDRIISVAVEPLWAAGRLSRGRPKWRMSNPYNGLGVCDSLRGLEDPRGQPAAWQATTVVGSGHSRAAGGCPCASWSLLGSRCSDLARLAR